MKKRPSRNDRRREFRTGVIYRSNAAFHEARRRVHGNANALEDFANSARGSDEIMIIAAETLIEAALKSADPIQQVRCTAAAADNLTVLQDKFKRFGLYNGDSLRTDVMQIYTKPYSYLAIMGTLPPAEHKTGATETHRSLSATATKVSNKWDRYDASLKQNGKNITGPASELIAMTLLERYAARKIGDGSFEALPTTFNNGRAATAGPTCNNNWDITCLVQYGSDSAPQIGYKVEVKSSKRALEYSKRHYAEGIAVIALKEDVLTDQTGHQHGFRKTLDMLAYDAKKEDGAVAYTLDGMEERLLEAIDERS